MSKDCEEYGVYKYGFFTALGAFALTVGFVIKSAMSKKKSAHELDVESTETIAADGTRTIRKKVHASIGREEETQEKGAAAQMSMMGSKDSKAITPGLFGGGIGLGGGLRVDPKASPTGEKMAHRMIYQGTKHALGFVALDATEAAQHEAITHLAGLITPATTPQQSLRRIVDDPRFNQLVLAKRKADAKATVEHIGVEGDTSSDRASKSAATSGSVTVSHAAQVTTSREEEEPTGRPKTDAPNLLARRTQGALEVRVDESSADDVKTGVASTVTSSPVSALAVDAVETVLTLATMVARGTSVDEAVEAVVRSPTFTRLASGDFGVAITPAVAHVSNPLLLTSDGLVQGTLGAGTGLQKPKDTAGKAASTSVPTPLPSQSKTKGSIGTVAPYGEDSDESEDEGAGATIVAKTRLPHHRQAAHSNEDESGGGYEALGSPRALASRAPTVTTGTSHQTSGEVVVTLDDTPVAGQDRSGGEDHIAVTVGNELPTMQASLMGEGAVISATHAST